MHWELIVFFRMSNGESFKFASFRSSKAQIVAQWLCVGRTKMTSQFYMALYDDQHRCLKAKSISLNSLNRLLSLWSKHILNKRIDEKLH